MRTSTLRRMCVAALFSTSCTSTNPHAARIDRLASALHRAGEYDGTILVSEAGHVIYRQAFGLANCETGEKNEIDTVFDLASIAKPFTALAVLMLAEEGRLDLHAPVRQYIPGWPYESVTVENLLTHTSGVPNYMHDPRFDRLLRGLEGRSAVADDVVRWLEIEQPALEFAPGERRRYSNTGYVVLGKLVEICSGTTYREFLQARIFDPLGMRRTLVWTEPSNPPLERWSRGHERSLDRKSQQPFSSGHGGKGRGIVGDHGIYSTVEDLLTFDRALYTERLVSTELLDKAFERFRLKNGELGMNCYGWFVRSEIGQPRVLWHGGRGEGYLTSFHREIDEHNTVIILSNGSSHHLTIDGLAQAILDILHDRDFRQPPIPISHPIANRIFAEGADSAVELYHQLHDSAGSEYIFDENELNLLGYQLMWAGRIDDALEVLKLNASEYPEWANAYDSLGDVYREVGDLEASRRSYEAALRLNPEATGTQGKLRELEESVKN